MTEAIQQNHNGAVEKTRAAKRYFTPPVDIFENQDGFSIVADLPGVEADGVSIEYNPPELHVAARNTETDSVYERRFEVGSGLDPTSIEAELKDGVLRIQVKKSAALKPRRIAVKAS
jgi:HSP20 family molecular chaperone IbpA